MNEIEKLYKNVGIEIPVARLKIFKDDNGEISTRPPFTAEKQIELIRWISRKEGFKADGFSIEFGTYATGHSPDFEIALAESINCFLEYCSPEEKQQIKEILE